MLRLCKTWDCREFLKLRKNMFTHYRNQDSFAPEIWEHSAIISQDYGGPDHLLVILTHCVHCWPQCRTETAPPLHLADSHLLEEIDWDPLRKEWLKNTHTHTQCYMVGFNTFRIRNTFLKMWWWSPILQLWKKSLWTPHEFVMCLNCAVNQS